LVNGTRVQVYLPVNTTHEKSAARRVIKFLYDTYEGVTQSSLSESIYRGYWFDADNEVLYQDDIAIAWVDIRHLIDDQDACAQMDLIRNRAAIVYSELGSPQLEIWITAESVILPS